VVKNLLRRPCASKRPFNVSGRFRWRLPSQQILRVGQVDRRLSSINLGIKLLWSRPHCNAPLRKQEARFDGSPGSQIEQNEKTDAMGSRRRCGFPAGVHGCFPVRQAGSSPYGVLRLKRSRVVAHRRCRVVVGGVPQPGAHALVLVPDGLWRGAGLDELRRLAVLRSGRRARAAKSVLGGHPAVPPAGADDGGGGHAAGIAAARAEIPSQHAEFPDSPSVVGLPLHVFGVPQRIRGDGSGGVQHVLFFALRRGVRGADVRARRDGHRDRRRLAQDLLASVWRERAVPAVLSVVECGAEPQ